MKSFGLIILRGQWARASHLTLEYLPAPAARFHLSPQSRLIKILRRFPLSPEKFLLESESPLAPSYTTPVFFLFAKYLQLKDESRHSNKNQVTNSN